MLDPLDKSKSDYLVFVLSCDWFDCYRQHFIPNDLGDSTKDSARLVVSKMLAESSFWNLDFDSERIVGTWRSFLSQLSSKMADFLEGVYRDIEGLSQFEVTRLLLVYAATQRVIHSSADDFFDRDVHVTICDAVRVAEPMGPDELRASWKSSKTAWDRELALFTDPLDDLLVDFCGNYLLVPKIVTYNWMLLQKELDAETIELLAEWYKDALGGMSGQRELPKFMAGYTD